MRAIKFRAWDGSKMHYDGVVIYLREAWLEKASFESDKILLESTNPCVPMQYTGLKDKNGLKDVYESDIIDEYGNIKGNIYEMDKGEADLVIEDFGGRNWCDTYKEAMARGLTNS